MKEKGKGNMGKQDQFMKIQTCVLRVNIHCDGCKQKVRKILQKIDGVYSCSIDAEQGKVSVSGCFDPAKLINKLEKSGKHAEFWGLQKGSSKNNNNNHHHHQANFNDQFKNIQIGDGGFKGHNNNNKSQKGINGKDQAKGGGGGGGHSTKDQKSVKFNKNEFDSSDLDDFDDEFDDGFDEEYDDDDEFYDDEDEDEEFSHGHNNQPHNHHNNNNKAVNMVMPKAMHNINHHNGPGPLGPYGKVGPIMSGGNGPYGPKGMIDIHSTKDKKGGGGGGGGGGSFKKGSGGVIDFPLEVKGKVEGKISKEGGKSKKKQSGSHDEGGKKKSGGGGLLGLFGLGKKKSGKGKVPKKGGKNKGSLSFSNSNSSFSFTSDDDDDHKKNKGKGGDGKKGDQGKSKNIPSSKGNNNNKHEEGHKGKKSEFEFDFSSAGGGGGGKGGKMGHAARPVGPMGNYPMPGGPPPAVRGLPAQPMMSGGYFQEMGHGPGYGGPNNPYSQGQLQQHQQQQYMNMMMNQQRGNNGNNDMFQQMMYSRVPPAMNYAPMPMMPRHHPANDNLTHFFSDENTESCSVM